ncbi:MAG: LysM peptidoglycan-binding domain-containing protein [Deltaproteobacteria bacterium]|nr:LysM peptidoglycan-binding domain-containing protein [Deltaproteobacteria bacterium]
MRRFFLCILVPCILTSLATPGFSEKTLRLFFEKDTTANPLQTKKYTVKDGDWLFNILTKNGYSNEEIHRLLPAIQQSNPHIQNLDRLLPGQKLYIPKPQALKKTKTEKKPKQEKSETSSRIQKPYVVRSGDTVISIMQQQGIPRQLVFSKYMSLFQQLNPDVPDINNLREGQNIFLPLPNPADIGLSGNASNATPESFFSANFPGNATSKNAFDSLNGPGTAWDTSMLAQLASITPLLTNPSPLASMGGQAPASGAGDTNTIPTETRQPTTGLPYVRGIFKEMRFAFAPGDEELYPLPDGGWLQVKLEETPLMTTPWGEKVILCPIPKNSEWIAKANRLGMHVCSVAPDWSLPDIIKTLTKKFPEKIRLWNPGQDLSLSRNGLGLTIKMPHTVIIQHRGQKMVHALWGRQAQDDRALPQGLPEVLRDMGVKVIETDQFNEVTRLPTQPRQSVYIPVAEHRELIRALDPDNPQEFFGPSLPEDLDGLLRLLKSRDQLHQGFANLAWSGGADRRIALQVPAWIVGPPSGKTILLDRRFADEYLISLLAHEGYTCFVLPD